MNIYFNASEEHIVDLSRMAYALVLPLSLLSDKDNMITKREFTETVRWIKNDRTWAKYWKELEDNNTIVRVDRKHWMLSPHVAYSEGATFNSLVRVWDAANGS